MDHKMTMAQYLEYQRLLEKTTDQEKCGQIRSILKHAEVTNPIVVAIKK